MMSKNFPFLREHQNMVVLYAVGLLVLFPSTCNLRGNSAFAASAPNLLTELADGNPVQAGQALVSIGGSPAAALSNREELLDAVKHCAGDIDLAVIPVTRGRYRPEWSRAETVLAWLADSIREGPRGLDRTTAQAWLLAYCREVLKDQDGPVSPARAFECAVRCVFYLPDVLVEPKGNLDAFLSVLDEAVDLEAAKRAREEERDSGRWYCRNRDLDQAIGHCATGLKLSTRWRNEELFQILDGNRGTVRPATLDINFSDPVTEDFIFQLRKMAPEKLISLARDERVYYASYRHALAYVLTETRQRQADNIDLILEASDMGFLPVGRVALPVFEVSLEYEKLITDKLILFLQEKLNDPSKLAPVPQGKTPLRPISQPWEAVRILAGMVDPSSRSPHRTDIYQRKQITAILVQALAHRDSKTQIEAAKGLAIAATLDADCARIAGAAVRPAME